MSVSTALCSRGGRSGAALALALALALVLGSIAGCSRLTPAERHPAAKNIQQLLELRREKVDDPARYGRYFAESEVATSLADSAREATEGQRLVPEWQRPYVSDEGTSTAEVVVRWRRDEGPEGFPAATVFKMRLEDGEWRAVDASEVASDTAIPAPLSRSADR